MMTTRIMMFALLISALAVPVAAQKEAKVMAAIQPLVGKCPEVSEMIERWKTSPPGTLAKLVSSWEAAPVIEEKPEHKWGKWETVVKGWPGGGGAPTEWEGRAISKSVLGGRMLLDMVEVSPRSTDGDRTDSLKLVGVTGPQGAGFVSMFVHNKSDDCFVMQGEKEAEEIRFVGERARRILGLRSHSLELTTADGTKTMEIVYKRASKKEPERSIGSQTACIVRGEICSKDNQCCDSKCLLHYKEENGEQVPYTACGGPN